ncbi:hypothetical protein QN277_020536 [Acacia crassicarpa]|uniref:TCP domain-containing protein n=1 Tax=Acacia crassicarpa TaxID=499986 RepID=A0AAE1MS73_9FABA|nr:hypothetical protein QN277_020536 [Acacia crassicarpa]
MIKIPKEASDLSRKQEEGGGNDHDSPSKYFEKERALLASSSTTTSRSMIEPKWVRLQDPRIVRVARACGGKDRHSKVCTIRGLRDRRVRLSVTTAIQLYDLQERLGFNQPSKVIDWLLHAAKSDIDQLPPLPQLNLPLAHHHHAILTSNSPPNQEEDDHDVKQQVTNNDDDHNELSHPRHHHHNPSIVGYHGEGVHVSHETDLQSLNVVPFSSTLSLSTGDSSHHHHNFASQHFGGNMDMDDHNHILPRQVNYNNNHYPAMLMSSSSNLYHPISMAQSLKPFGLSMMTPNNTATTATDQSQSHNHLQNFPSNK